MKFLILGCNGMAGHTISLYLKEKGHEVFGFDRTKSLYIDSVSGDAKDTKFVRDLIGTNKYDSVINCIGILNQFAEENKSLATFLNSYFPHFLAEITDGSDTQIIHMSTDCVFSGKRGCYTEDDFRDGETFYDRSKALGELDDKKNITLRNSIVGPDINPNGNLEQIKASNILETLGLEKGKYILLSAHREENIDTEANFFSLMNAVNAMAEKYDMPILYSCHPRSAKFIEKRGFVFDKRVMQNKPLGFHDYNNLQMNAFAVVSDSGTLPEESSYFLSVGNPFPAICIRTSTERPEALDKGNFILAGITTEQVLQAVDTAVDMNRNGDYGIPVPDYIEENVSTKVVKIIQSYTGVVDKMVWRKY